MKVVWDTKNALKHCARIGKRNVHEKKVSQIVRRGVGIAGLWYGCGNTALPNPSTIMVGVLPSGKIVLHQGAVDIGQGSNTVMTQILADALSISMDNIIRVGADTNSTPDAGKTSASRQTFVSGKATYLAGIALRKRFCNLLMLMKALQLKLLLVP